MKKGSWILSLLVLIIFIGMLAFVLLDGNEEKKLEITAEVDAEKDFKCDVIIEDEDVVRYVENYFLINDGEESSDGKSYMNFVFEGQKKGRTKITILCTDTVEGTVLSENTYNIIVHKNLETSISLSEK